MCMKLKLLNVTLQVESTVRRVCELVLADPSIDKRQRKARAEGLKLLGKTWRQVEISDDDNELLYSGGESSNQKPEGLNSENGAIVMFQHYPNIGAIR